MRKVILIVLLLGSISLLLVHGLRYYNVIDYLMREKTASTLEPDSSEPVLAQFSLAESPEGRMLNNFRHYRLKLNDVHDLNIVLDSALWFADSIPLFFTIETRAKNVFPSHENNPVDDVISGRYDKVFRDLCENLIGQRSNVYFRFNPEMEVSVDLFPWQRYGPAYIDAFCHFSGICKLYAPQIKLVWGPAGYPGSMEYYPGDDFVDVASVTVHSDSELMQSRFPVESSVSQDLYRRIHRLRFFSKPIFVLGSKQIDRDSITEHVIASISEKIKRNPQIYTDDNFKRPQQLTGYERDKLEIGLYDPDNLLNSEPPVTVEHIFADFGNIRDGSFEKRFREVLDRGHNVIATIEPYFSYSDNVDDKQVLQNVTKGKYDQEISHLYSIVQSTSRIVYLRYAHEMEIPITRYQWQSQDPADYINSFRYFMTFPDSLSPNVKRIWGPAGDRGSDDFWPGSDVVDFISIAIYGLPDKNITDPNMQESFSKIFARKSYRMRLFDKPMFITEFGVKGSEEYQNKWLEDAAQVIRENPQVVGVNYFNMSDTPKAWGDIPPPHWGISKTSLYTFLNQLGIR